MKNRYKIYPIIVFIYLSIYSILIANDFTFETSNIKITDKGNIINATNGEANSLDGNIKIIADLKKTWFLKTAIIENEWINNLNNDIFDGPKYLNPLIESISFKLLICFDKDPEKLLQRLGWWDKMFTSFFVKQL